MPISFDLLPNYPDRLVSPRSQVVSVGAEREAIKGLFVGSDYVHQHWTNLDRTVDLNAPSTSNGQDSILTMDWLKKNSVADGFLATITVGIDPEATPKPVSMQQQQTPRDSSITADLLASHKFAFNNL